MMFSRTRRFFGILASALLLTGCLAAQLAPVRAQTSYYPSSKTIFRAYFGQHIRHLDSTTTWPVVDLGTFRIWDTSTTWMDIEPNAPVNGVHTYSWGKLDGIVQKGIDNGVDMIYCFGYTPKWSTSRPKAPPWWAPGASAPPKSMSDWTDFVSALATRYRGKIKYYEVWNEPNNTDFWSGTKTQLVDMAKNAYQTIAAVDPTAQVLTPAPYDSQYLAGYLDAGGGAYAHIIAFHNYGYNYGNTPEDRAREVAAVQTIKNNRNLISQPLWASEVGWLTASGITLTDDQKTQYVLRMFILGWAAGAQREVWWAWDETDPSLTILPLTQTGGNIPTSAGWSLNTIKNWLQGNRMNSCTSTSAGTWTAKLTRPDGSTFYLVWNTTGFVSYTPPSSWNVTTQTFTDGSSAPVSSSTMVSGWPSMFTR